MAGYLPYSQARAALAAQRPRQRPWSPPIVDPRSTAAGRDIEAFLAHASHGWAAEREDGPHNQQAAADDDLFSRHRTLFRGRREASSDHNYGYEYTYNRARNQRREASDVSVEALDLADYAMTLKRQGPEWDPYPSYDYPTPTAQRPFSRENPPTTATAPTLSSGRRRREAELSPHHNAPPSAYPHERLFSPAYLTAAGSAPPLDRPFSALSRDTTRPPPSLISAGATSHSSHAESSYPPAPSSSQSPHRLESLRRPQSLPVDFLPPRWPTILTPPPIPSSPHQTTRHTPPVDLQSFEANVNSFPPWARSWYDTRNTTIPVPRKDIASPAYSAETGFYTHPSAAGSQRDLLPWSTTNARNAEERITEEVKAERLRMLEREFGDAEHGKNREEEGPDGMIGSVDEHSRLITAGPKKRVAVRVLQGLFAGGTAVSGIYGALFIKSPNPPPAAGKPAAFVLYIFSSVTFLAIIYMYGLRPCFGRRKHAQQANTTNPAGMMVLPVTNPMQSKKKKGKKGHKKGGAGGGGSVQVNLIVDPTMFGTKRGNNTLPGQYDTDEDEEGSVLADGTSRRRQGPPRRSFFQSMAMEERWKYARSELKKLTAFDTIMMVFWLAAFVFVLMGERCPNGGNYNGWCAAYNWATAGACLLAVTFLVNLFFDVKDLRDSKVSPRTRTRT